MNATALPDDLDTCHQLIASLQSQITQNQQTIDIYASMIESQASTIESQASRIDSLAIELSLKNKLVEEQAHSVLALKSSKYLSQN